MKIYTVDSFTDRPFAGNPAAVVPLEQARAEEWMQAVAAEMNLSETAFTVPNAEGTFHLRWFTPTSEAELCGHATLAAAHILWSEGHLAPDAPARFTSMSGPLTCHRQDDGMIRMDFPSQPPAPIDTPADLAEILGVPAILGCTANDRDLLAEVATQADVLAAAPDFRRLMKIPRKCIIVTAPADDPNIDFVSRFFAPAYGIDEDPVTGSAHCALGPFWGERLGKAELRARQLSHRTGDLVVRLNGDRVDLLGRAVTVLRGELAGG